MEINRLRRSGMLVEGEIDERRTLIEYSECQSISSLDSINSLIHQRLQSLRWMKRKLHEWDYRMRGRRSKWNLLFLYPWWWTRCIPQQIMTIGRGERREAEGQIHSFLETRNTLSISIESWCDNTPFLSHVKAIQWWGLIWVSWQISPRFRRRNLRCMVECRLESSKNTCKSMRLKRNKSTSINFNEKSRLINWKNNSRMNMKKNKGNDNEKTRSNVKIWNKGWIVAHSLVFPIFDLICVHKRLV